MSNIRFKHEIRSYETAHSVWCAYHNGQGFVQLGYRTRLYPIGNDAYAIRHFITNVVTYCADGRIILNTDGYRTPTTKTRINEFSPVGVYQKDFTWYLVDSTGGQEFYDGVEVYA